MSLEKFIEDFEEAVEDIEPGSLTAETAFKELKSWDSLAVLTLTDALEMEYGTLLNKNSFESVTTIQELYNVVIRKR
jgi:acyl carrier protein